MARYFAPLQVHLGACMPVGVTCAHGELAPPLICLLLSFARSSEVLGGGSTWLPAAAPPHTLTHTHTETRTRPSGETKGAPVF